MKNNKNSKILIILFTSDFYKYYYALNLASTYKAADKDVSIFYTGYAVNFLSKYWKKYDRKKINNRLIKKKNARPHRNSKLVYRSKGKLLLL